MSPLWCLHYIFIGSMFTYLIMLLFNKINNKTLLFIILVVFSIIIDPIYFSFVIGIISAYIANKEFVLKKYQGILIILLGCIFGLFPPVFVPSFISMDIMFGIGAGLIIVGTHFCFKNNYFLNNKFINFFGKESLSAIIVQFIIMQSLNIYLFILFYNNGMDMTLNILINIFINLILTGVFTWVYSKTITLLTNIVCNKVSSVLINED